MSTYESLKAERNKLKGLLDANRNLRHHSTYKNVEAKYRDVQKQIKQLFRLNGNNRTTK